MTHPFENWFESRGWTAWSFQREAWRAYASGKSGLVHAPTGSGKTLAVWGGPVGEAMGEPTPRGKSGAPIRVLWITPLRALANDTLESLREPVEALGVPWVVQPRTGDTKQSMRQRQRKRLPAALVTTPESLSLLLSYPESVDAFATLQCVIVDEWHEMLGTKRGVQTELCLARLRRLAPGLRTWGLSATLGNIDEAASVLLGDGADKACVIRGESEKAVEVETLRPDAVDAFPWSGHLGTVLLPQVVERLEQGGTTLLFTNTRSQAEAWFRRLLEARPDWLGHIALHHGSLDRGIRHQVEDMLRAGSLRCVVCTSSLDLGVDFSPVDQVMQLGSPKGVARLLQRAGRSGHQPGAISRVYGVPTNALELVEFAAARDAILDVTIEGNDESLEQRTPVTCPLDVLAQHLVTLGAGGHVTLSDTRDEIQSTHSFRNLDDASWAWVLDFLTRGGTALQAYPQYKRLAVQDDRLTIQSAELAKRHRMGIGTITGDTMMSVRLGRGRRLGTIEERFISRLNPGDRFVFAGRTVELVRVRGLNAEVRATRARRGLVPRWMGGRCPLSTQLADRVQTRLEHAADGCFEGPEMELVRPLLEAQSSVSVIPRRDEILIETISVRRVHFAFVFSFAGRLVNEGLMSLIGARLSGFKPISLSMTGNDWGFQLESRTRFDLDEDGWYRLLSPDNLLEDLFACLNTIELSRRTFRGIAQIAGLVFTGYPGQPKTARHLQASSDLFFDVFQEFDPSNPLLDQARREVLERELEVQRLRATLESIASKKIVVRAPSELTPLSFPLWADSIRRQQVSSESWTDRVTRMAESLGTGRADAECTPPVETVKKRRRRSRSA